jgi:hypothetical protein
LIVAQQKQEDSSKPTGLHLQEGLKDVTEEKHSQAEEVESVQPAEARVQLLHIVCSPNSSSATSVAVDSTWRSTTEDYSSNSISLSQVITDLDAAALSGTWTMSTTVVATGGKGSNPKTTLYVGGLAENVNEEILQAAFLPFGNLKDINIPLDHATGQHRGEVAPCLGW